MATVLDFDMEYRQDWEAFAIGEMWRKYNTFRLAKIEELVELRKYLFATDTRSTQNKHLPHLNSTTTPKLTQIRDNLHAQYMAALFPSDQFARWEANDTASNKLEKRRAIENYVFTKARQSGYKESISRLVLDWIDTGNAFGMVEYVSDVIQKENGVIIPNYSGPNLVPISIYDIVFNPLAPSFNKTFKIVKELITVGDMKRRVKNNPGDEYLEKAFEDMVRIRGAVSAQDSELHKSEMYIADGFSSVTQYYDSGYVELLHFFGDIHNSATGEYQDNRIITVADRARVIRNIEAPSWLGANVIRHSGWRKRPDNLYAMGPLENLVGLQYRIDHLENMKADIWDQIAYPKYKIKGEVRDWDEGLNQRIYLEEDGDVAYLAPDATALNADVQIADIAAKMEELAGAPKSAMGFRTPGEKTAFEFQALSEGANRIFEHKAREFEVDMVEPTLNDYLVVGRQNMNEVETVRIDSPEMGGKLFRNVSIEDITANGLLRPRGAAHFAERTRRIGNLVQLHQIKMSDPTIAVHMSGKKFAEILSEELGEETLYTENIALYEQAETQSTMQELEVQSQEQQQVAAEEGI